MTAQHRDDCGRFARVHPFPSLAVQRPLRAAMRDWRRRGHFFTDEQARKIEHRVTGAGLAVALMQRGVLR